MKKVLCLGEVSSHNWTELMVKEGLITHRFNSCSNAFDLSETFDFRSSHRIFDKKHLLFLMVLFEEITSSSIVNFPLDEIESTGIIKKNRFHIFERMENYFEFLNVDKEYFTSISIDFMKKNKSSLIKYLSSDVLHTSHFQVDADIDLKTFFDSPYGTGVQKNFNPNVFILRQIRDALSLGLKVSQDDEMCFYNGRLSHQSRKAEMIDAHEMNKCSDDVRYILQLDLSSQINEFPIPNNMTDVLYLRKQSAIISFREVFFNWLGCLQVGEYDLASRIKNDVIKANAALEKYNKWEKKKTNLFYCTIDALVGLIPYLSTFLGIISPYSLRATIKDKNDNSWVNLLK